MKGDMQMKKFLGVLLSVCLLLGLTAFPAAASGETSDRVMFVQWTLKI